MTVGKGGGGGLKLGKKVWGGGRWIIGAVNRFGAVLSVVECRGVP